MEKSEDAVERALRQAVPSLDPSLRMPLRFDLVNQIHDYETIGQRYGFGGADGLKEFLVGDREFCAEVAKLRAMLSSDMSAQERGRLKAAIASEELVADIASIVANAANTAGARIDGFKQLNRMAGIDGQPAASKDNQAQAGTTFSLTINMPDGRTENITTVVEAPSAALPPPADDE